MSKNYIFSTPTKHQITDEEYTVNSEYKLSTTISTHRNQPQQQHQLSYNNNFLKLAGFRIVNKRINDCFLRILLYSHKNRQGKKRIAFGISRVFRTAEHDVKFSAFQKFKKLQIGQKTQQLKYSEKVLSDIVETGGRLFLNFFRIKHRRILEESFSKMKAKAAIVRSQAKGKLLKMYRIIVDGRKDRLRESINRMRVCKYIYNRKLKARGIINVIRDTRRRTLLGAFGRIKRNMLSYREIVLKNDVGELDRKIHTQSSQQVQSYKEKMETLENQMKKVIEEKEQISAEFKKEISSIQEKSHNLRQQLQDLSEENLRISHSIAQVIQETNQPFSIDEVCQFLYNSLVVFLHNNPDVPLKKADLITALQNPLLPVNVDLDRVKQENQIMKELLREYIVIFGMRTLAGQQRLVDKPYEYIQKENLLLHRIMITLIGRVNMTRDDIGSMRDRMLGLADAVRELDKFSNNLNEKKKLLL